MGAYAGVRMTNAGNSAPVIINISTQATWQVAPAWSLGLICTISNGASLTYSVQVTADQQPSSSGNWNNHDVLNGQTASANSNIAYPVTGVRLVVSNYVSGSVNLGIAQWP